MPHELDALARRSELGHCDNADVIPCFVWFLKAVPGCNIVQEIVVRLIPEDTVSTQSTSLTPK